MQKMETSRIRHEIMESCLPSTGNLWTSCNYHGVPYASHQVKYLNYQVMVLTVYCIVKLSLCQTDIFGYMQAFNFKMCKKNYQSSYNDRLYIWVKFYFNVQSIGHLRCDNSDSMFKILSKITCFCSSYICLRENQHVDTLNRLF